MSEGISLAVDDQEEATHALRHLMHEERLFNLAWPRQKHSAFRQVRRTSRLPQAAESRRQGYKTLQSNP